jgi:hypothetical protein
MEAFNHRADAIESKGMLMKGACISSGPVAPALWRYVCFWLYEALFELVLL